MKRVLMVVLAVVFIAGCGKGDSEINTALALRDRILQCQGISFDAVIAADYEDSVHTFSMKCAADSEGDITFTVTDPQSISGITGNIRAGKGELTFDDTILAFEPMTDLQISPVISPWLFLYALRSGYITACGREGQYQKITIDDTYKQEVLQLDIWLENGAPMRAEILWQGRRCVSIDIRNFTYL